MFFKTLFKYSLILTCATLLILQTTNILAAEQQPEETTATKSIVFKKTKQDKGYVVYINNKQAMWFVKGTEDSSAQLRAQKATEQIQRFINENNNPKIIRPIKNGKNVLIKAGNTVLATADPINAKAFGVSVHELAYTWANATRIALGAPKMIKDYSQASRGAYSLDFQRKYLGKKQFGLASWYGGFFHGQRASDGSRYNKEEFTAAHKTLPFGTLVKVTNLKTNKTCVVKITDRGPYVGDRIIDLSRASATELGTLARGVARVQLEIIGKY